MTQSDIWEELPQIIGEHKCDSHDTGVDRHEQSRKECASFHFLQCLDPVFDDGSFVSNGDFEDAFQRTITYKSRIHNVELNEKRRLSLWETSFLY